MRIRIKSAMQSLGMEKPHELALFLDMSRQIGYHWERNQREYLSEQAAFRLLQRRPELKRLAEDRAA